MDIKSGEQFLLTGNEPIPLQAAWDVVPLMDHVFVITVSVHWKHLAVNQTEVTMNSAEVTAFWKKSGTITQAMWKVREVWHLSMEAKWVCTISKVKSLCSPVTFVYCFLPCRSLMLRERIQIPSFVVSQICLPYYWDCNLFSSGCVYNIMSRRI